MRLMYRNSGITSRLARVFFFGITCFVLLACSGKQVAKFAYDVGHNYSCVEQNQSLPNMAARQDACINRAHGEPQAR